jgi:hypothetical protein
MADWWVAAFTVILVRAFLRAFAPSRLRVRWFSCIVALVKTDSAVVATKKPKAPTSLRSHGLIGGGAAFYLSGVTVQSFFVGAAFSRE